MPLDLALPLCYSTNVVTMPSRCASDNCNSTAPQMCNKCKVTSYCSRACQRAHWRQHKYNCHTGVFPFLQLPREIRDKVSDTSCRLILSQAVADTTQDLRPTSCRSPIPCRLDRARSSRRRHQRPNLPPPREHPALRAREASRCPGNHSRWPRRIPCSPCHPWPPFGQ